MSATAKKRGLSFEQLPLSALKPDPKNPRKHPDWHVRELARTIGELGFCVPILIDRDGKIVAGHGRYLAAAKLGLEAVPVIRIEDLTDAQAKALALADNRLQEHSRWDDELLAEVLAELASQDLDFSLEATGFSYGDIDVRLAKLDAAGGSADAVDELPPATTAPAVSKPGDLWKLGDHLLLCGDALQGESYRVVMGDKRAHVVVADIPYNVKIVGHAGGKGRIQHREFAMASGEMESGEFEHFIETVMHQLVRNSVDGSIHYFFMDWAHAREMLAAGTKAYTELKNICIWCKNVAGMGSLYRSQHEMVFVWKSGRARHRNNVELGKHGRSRSNVWQYPSQSAFGHQGEEGRLLALHPSVKPVQLVADAVVDVSARGDLVLDPVLGSGTTLLAAERVGRICRAIELDPLYVDTAIRRWQRYTGGRAVHATSGKTFDSLANREKGGRRGR